MYYNEYKNEIHGILFLLLGLLILASLISFTPSDIPFLYYPVNVPVRNWISTVGVYLSFFLRFLFGYGSLWIPILLIYWGVVRLFKLEERFNISINFNIIAVLFFLFFSSSLLSVFKGVNSHDLSFRWGGLIGYSVAAFLFRYFGVVGSWIISIGLFLLSFVMLTRISILIVARFFISPLLWIANLIKKIKFSSSRDGLYYDEEVGKPDFGRKNSQRKKRRSRIDVKGLFDEEVNEKMLVSDVGSDEGDGDVSLDFGLDADEKSIVGSDAVDEDTDFDLRVNEGKKLKPPSKGRYKLPSIELLDTPIRNKQEKEDIGRKARIIEQSLAEFNIPVKVVNVESGPVITRYELEPAPGVKIQRIVNLADDLALNLRASSIRIVAPIPGKGAVGIEVPNMHRDPVFLRDIVKSAEFQNSDSPITIGLGKDTAGHPVVADLRDMPHLLIAGATGSGKTVCVNALITSMLMKASPEQLRFILVDPKMVEMTQYNKLPHLLCPVVTDVKKVSSTLNWLIAEMEKRYQVLAKEGVRNIRFYNQRHMDNPMPYIVLIIDELADIMAVAQSEVETGIARLAQLSRAVGIHLILATQRPSVDVITGVIKANFPARISFKVASRVDSRTVLDSIGAEKLLGKGDMLFMKPGAVKIQRIQGCYVQDREIERIVEFICAQADQHFDETVIKTQTKSFKLREKDELFDEAVDIILTTGQASVSILQRRMRLGYARAARLIDMMEEEGIVGPYRGSRPREILIDRQQWLRQKEGFDVGEN